jgi:two-component system sensor histidine kinase BaeS
MRRTLWAKFLLLLLAVVALALSATFVLRGLMVRDFRAFLEGQTEDRVYWITADAERTYEKEGGWSREWLDEDALWALMLGFEIRVLDTEGRVVSDTARAIDSVSAPMRGRFPVPLPPAGASPAYVPYPLFLSGEQIGTLEARRIGPLGDAPLVERSNQYLVASVLALGGAALALSAFAARRLTRRLARLASAAASVGRGDLTVRAEIGAADELGSLADTFNRMAAALQGFEQQRKKLLTDLAHDLRTPLSAIRGELEGMMDGLIPTTKEGLQSLHEEAGRLRRMLDGLEDLARAQASALTLVKERVPLRQLLGHLLERTQRGAAGKQVKVHLDCAEDLTIRADPDRLGQVMGNLLANAVKAVRSGGEVTVTCRRFENEVEIAVEDDGIGIAEADLPYVFDRFYRRSEGGLGIGLAIAKELVEAHGGRITAESAPGQGAKFTIWLPE